MTDNYKVLALKYRPQTFEDVIGQGVLVKTLTNAIQKNKIHHAFILTGIRGVGKTTTARLIAKSLNCIGADGNGKETIKPCLECCHCRAIANSVDQDVIEFDAASHTGVNDIRDIIDSINYAPISSRYKIYIIDEVHMLSNSAFNALLKTLEEPPAHVKFVFATTEIRKVPVTILSRCIRFDLNKVPQDELAKHLIDVANRENYNLDKVAASMIANAADGSVRDSLSLLDRVVSFNNFFENIGEDAVVEVLGLGGKEKLYSLYTFLLRQDIGNVLKTFDDMYASIVSVETFLGDLLEITHLLLLRKNSVECRNISGFQKTWIDDNMNLTTISSLFRMWQFLLKGIAEVKLVSNYRSFLEVLLLKIIYGISIPEINDLIKKIQNNTTTTSTVDTKRNLTEKLLNTFDGSKVV
ncbi:MAG: DNA polymerase III subunit gamma/tau [Rickettsiales bacterium]|jgi:DNA polymerase-3 subunit gamma/tau|nr:DNA polymerase III subunit gamma/tau [Rickettsiales bacterium]